jgi:hypothetical protein
MATTDFQITDQDIGRVLPITDGFLVNLSMTTPPVHETPAWDEGRRCWVAGYLVLRGQRDIRDLICVDPLNNGHSFSWWARDANSVVNGSIGYAGDLIVECVPKGAVFELTLSDVPNPRATDTATGVSDRMAALERNMQRRQLGEARRA